MSLLRPALGAGSNAPELGGEVADLDGRDFVRVVFQDMGTGIKKEKVDKIFEPFFSSKTKGEGTGLGLSISKEIIARHGGFLHVESQEGEYTRMIVELPACEEGEAIEKENGNWNKI